MLDVIEALRPYLAEAVGVPVYAEVPRKRPEEFVTIERTGGDAEIFGAIDRPTLAVQSWAATNLDASKLAASVDDAMLYSPWNVENVMSCERNTLHNFPDPDSRSPRYQGLYELVTN